MKYICLILSTFLLFGSCSNKRQVVYLKDLKNHLEKVDFSKFSNSIEPGDILSINIKTIVPEAAIPFNKITNDNAFASENFLKLSGYYIDTDRVLDFPVLGKISVNNLNLIQLQEKIFQLLVDGGHLTKPHVSVRRINSKFTVLGEVNSPGTYAYYEKKLNLFQALGYAGDLNIYGKRNNIKLVREENGVRKFYNIELSKSDLFNKPYYNIKNNDVIIVEPNFSKVKSAGFIGSIQSITAFSSLIVSITLLILNSR